jgi:hypothetical protein
LSYPTEIQDPDIPELVDLRKFPMFSAGLRIMVLIFHPNLHLIEITYVLPGILPNDDPYELNSMNSVAKAWLSTCVGNPFLFNVLTWSTCIKRNFIHGSRIYCNSTQALTYKVAGIQQLNKVISNGRKVLTDEVILAIVGLAAHEVVNVTEDKIKPFSSPLQSAGLLDVYGGMQVVPEHRDAILRLVTMRGGIENLTLLGLAEGMVM